ncbi:hypothetical protein CVT24_012734 [Panaeolus cyanescens]|uniref:Uncharacterized protein n=1 Tax=Panaeolus cyanescens TaxID=181874 RepID=A0A409W746_9AGAR|nr:hypothetical protein CVT24_012734 [Panaeolus cyanescens]
MSIDSPYIGINNNAGIDLNMDLLPGNGQAPSSSSANAFPVAVQAPSYLLNAQLAQARQQQSQSHPQFSRYEMSQPRYPNSSASNSTNNSRRGSVDVYTDGSSDAGHGSGASGRASVDRLFDSYHVSGSLPDRPSTASTTSSSSAASEQSSQHSDPFPTFAALERGGFDDRAEFSSSFGLMSLDDPDVTAGIATDGRPFFSHPDQAHNKIHLENGGDMTTPMPAVPGKRDSASMIQFPSGLPDFGSDKEGESKEDLREVWKQYMRTPLSGPDVATPGPGLGLPAGGTPRRQRVSSLPSVRTPSVHDSYAMQGLGGMLPPPNLPFPVGGAPLQQYSQHQQMYLAHNLKGKPVHASGLRTTLQGVPVNAAGGPQTDRDRKEDLKSYEAAVLARQTPLNLNLNLHKRARARGTSTSTTGSGHGASSGQQNRVSFAADVQTHDRDSSSPSNISRSPSAGGESESPRPHSGSGSSDQVEFPSMNSYGDVGDIDSPTGNSARPNFKRLPSQTLGPASAKRAYLGHDRDDEEGTGIPISATNSSNTTTQAPQDQYQSNAANPAAFAMMSHPDRVMVSLAERRRRRMSAPAPSNGLFPPPGTLRLDSVNPSGP